jgi:hypothetical protein
VVLPDGQPPFRHAVAVRGRAGGLVQIFEASSLAAVSARALKVDQSSRLVIRSATHVVPFRKKMLKSSSWLSSRPQKPWT